MIEMQLKCEWQLNQSVQKNIEHGRLLSLINNALCKESVWSRKTTLNNVLFANNCFGKLKERGNFFSRLCPKCHYFALHNVARGSRSCDHGFMFLNGHYKLGKSGPDKPYWFRWPWYLLILSNMYVNFCSSSRA